MDVSLQHVRHRITFSPQGAIVAGGPAEDFERLVQDLLRHGYRHIVADFSNVPSMDSAGVRALVRAHTTAKRRGLVFRIACPAPHVLSMIRMAQLENVLPIFHTVDEARSREVPWATVGLVIGAVLLCLALVWSGLRWNDVLTDGTSGASQTGLGGSTALHTPPGLVHPVLVLVKLAAAAMVGLLVTAVYRSGGGRAGRSMAEAQVLLCVSGAMVMVIIGDSVARAFGIAGAAAIIRFRTPVDDPKDVTVLFLLMGLGMAIGLGAFAAAGLATLFLSGLLVLLAKAPEPHVRPMLLEVVSDSRMFPMTHVESVLARNSVSVEPREIEQKEKESAVTYLALVPTEASLEDLNAQLMGDGARGVKSVSWESPKKSAA